MSVESGHAKQSSPIQRRIQLMDRRVFMAGLALGVLAAPRAASAQRARKIARIGILLFDRSVR